MTRFGRLKYVCDRANQYLGNTRFVLEKGYKQYSIYDNDLGTETKCYTLDEVQSSEEYYAAFFVVNGVNATCP